MEIQRYEMVQGIVHQDPSTNRFHVRCPQHLPARSEERSCDICCEISGARALGWDCEVSRAPGTTAAERQS